MSSSVLFIVGLYAAWFVIVMGCALYAGYGVSRLLAYGGLLRPSDEGYLLPDRERARALTIMRRQIPFAMIAFVAAATIAYIWLPTLMWRAMVFPSVMIWLGLIEGGELSQTHGVLAIFFANVMVQAPFQAAAYALALWIAPRPS